MRFVRSGLGAAICVALIGTGCVDPNDVKDIKSNQAKILEKLDQLSKRPAAPAAAQPRQRAGQPDPNAVYAFELGEAPVKGANDAWVTIVEVSDFQCPFCARVGPTLKQVQEKYGKDVRIVFKHNPLSFHQRALPAAIAAECAGEQGKFWEMHDRLFENQRALNDEDLEKYAQAIQIDAGKWKACYSAQKHKAKITSDQSTAASLGARGTPAFFINGRFLSGAQPFVAFDKLVGEELEKAKKSGISAGEYYSKAVISKGKKKL